MPAARGLSGEIARLLGRPENEGWVFVTRCHELGIIKPGRGGRKGAGAPMADAQEAMLLFLAMASGFQARQAVIEAATFATLPFKEVRQHRLVAQGEDYAVMQDPDPVSNFGEELCRCITYARINNSLPVSAIRFGQGYDNTVFAEVFGYSWYEPGKAETLFSLRFEAPFTCPASGFPLYRHAEVNGGILLEIAKLLGPISASGGGGIPLTDGTDDLEDGPKLIPLAAKQDDQPIIGRA
jgi:hypothetical protein